MAGPSCSRRIRVPGQPARTDELSGAREIPAVVARDRRRGPQNVSEHRTLRLEIPLGQFGAVLPACGLDEATQQIEFVRRQISKRANERSLDRSDPSAHDERHDHDDDCGSQR